MRYCIREIVALMMTVIAALPLSGENPSDSVKVYFRVGHSQFDPSLKGNRAAIDGFIDKVVKAKDSGNIDSLIVRGSASPSGRSAHNELLSLQRCEVVASYIAEHTGIEESLIRKVPAGVAWDELRRMVAMDPSVPSRDKVLGILDNTPVWVYDAQGRVVDSRKAQLMSLDGGKPYNWMLANLFPELQNAVAVVMYLKSSESAEIEPETAEIEPESPPIRSQLSDNKEIEIEEEEASIKGEMQEFREIDGSLPRPGGAGSKVTPVVKAPRNLYMAVKTNMLYDAALIPNLGAEFYLGKGLSIYGEWMYAWWDNNRRHRYWRIYGGDLGLKWWFGHKSKEKPLTGHHLGIYGGALTFDFEFGDTGYMGGKPGGSLWDRCIVNGGFEYGYSLPVASRLNIDFSIGIGYLGGNYIKYFPFDNDYYREKEIKLRYFGPTKAEISLVWLIGRGNVNKRKGGDR